MPCWSRSVKCGIGFVVSSGASASSARDYSSAPSKQLRMVPSYGPWRLRDGSLVCPYSATKMHYMRRRARVGSTMQLSSCSERLGRVSMSNDHEEETVHFVN